MPTADNSTEEEEEEKGCKFRKLTGTYSEIGSMKNCK
jgi:hypothetical protein